MRADCRQRKSPLRGGWRLVAAGSAAAAATTGGGELRAAAKERGGGRSAVRSHLRADLWLLSGWRQHTAYAAHDQHLDQPISIGFSINTCPIFLRRVTANTASMSQQWTYVAVKPRAERKRIRRKPFQSRRTCRETSCKVHVECAFSRAIFLCHSAACEKPTAWLRHATTCCADEPA
jgi:hypothetical protein